MGKVLFSIAEIISNLHLEQVIFPKHANKNMKLILPIRLGSGYKVTIGILQVRGSTQISQCAEKSKSVIKGRENNPDPLLPPLS